MHNAKHSPSLIVCICWQWFVRYLRSAQAFSNARTSTWMNQKGYILVTFDSKTSINIARKIMLYIPEMLRHTVMPGLQPGWTRKDILHSPTNWLWTSLKKLVNHVIYPRNAQAYSDARTSTSMNHKGYITFAD